MRCFPRYLLFALTVSYLVSCMNAGPDVQTPVQEPVTYEDTVYCFNQRSVVSLEGKKGLIDTEGQVVLEPEWDSIEFLDDEVALLSRFGIWYLCTKDGRLFAETSDPGILESSFRALLAEMQDKDSKYWDDILDRLEDLSEACINSRSKRPDARILRERALLSELLSSGIRGKMSASQTERLDKIVLKFNSLYRK